MFDSDASAAPASGPGAIPSGGMNDGQEAPVHNTARYGNSTCLHPFMFLDLIR